MHAKLGRHEAVRHSRQELPNVEDKCCLKIVTFDQEHQGPVEAWLKFVKGKIGTPFTPSWSCQSITHLSIARDVLNYLRAG